MNITPFDFASFDGPEHSIESHLKENELVGFSWSMLDFDGKTSEEQNPVHQYNRAGAWTVILTVEGPAGKSARSKVWDIVTQ